MIINHIPFLLSFLRYSGHNSYIFIYFIASFLITTHVVFPKLILLLSCRVGNFFSEKVKWKKGENYWTVSSNCRVEGVHGYRFLLPLWEILSYQQWQGFFRWMGFFVTVLIFRKEQQSCAFVGRALASVVASVRLWKFEREKCDCGPGCRVSNGKF